jgi:hypothetical protein
MKPGTHTLIVRPRIALILICTLLYLTGSGAVFAQVGSLFETSSVENRLTRQLKLTPKDRKALRPLFEWENDDLLSLYEYYSDQQDVDFLCLWNAMRSRRVEFADRVAGKLPAHQTKALALARYDFEKRILELWLDDHVQLLSDLLELDLVQFKQVQKVFYAEHRKRLEILRGQTAGPVRRDGIWQKLSDEREHELERILTGPQLSSYRRMISPSGLIATNR